MRIGVAGAGAIGGWLGVPLAAAGHAVSVLARGETLAALRHGWVLRRGGETTRVAVNAASDPAQLGEQDLLIITVKGPALPALAPRLAAMVGPHSTILPAMNGVPWWFLLGGGGELPPTTLKSVDPDGSIAAALPFGQVIGCVVHASAAAEAPAIVSHKAGNRLILGAASRDARVDPAAMATVFTAAGFDVNLSQHIQTDIWYKLWGNMTMNPISALTGATCDRILDDPFVSAFVLRIMAEAKAIGAQIGAPIAERGEDRNAVTRKLGAFKTSMLQDAEAGRPLELDQLLAAPLEIASRLGLAAPNMEALMGLARIFAVTRGLYQGM
jgi:2-dehydropantoate 2-reductase